MVTLTCPLHNLTDSSTHSLTRSLPMAPAICKHRIAVSDDSKVEQQNLCLWPCSSLSLAHVSAAQLLPRFSGARGPASTSNKTRTHKPHSLCFSSFLREKKKKRTGPGHTVLFTHVAFFCSGSGSGSGSLN